MRKDRNYHIYRKEFISTLQLNDLHHSKAIFIIKVKK